MEATMKAFKEDLSAVAEAAQDLAAKVEKLRKQYAEMEKKHPKVAPKRASRKKAPVRKPAPKESKKNAADSVLSAIGVSKKGKGAADIMEKTGFDRKKVYNTVAALKKQGKVRSAGRGRYAKA